MPDRRHELEAEKILARMGDKSVGGPASPEALRLIAEALEQAERRGRQASASRKESSG